MPMATATQPITRQLHDAFSLANGLKRGNPFLCSQHCWRFTVHSLPANKEAALFGHLTTMAAVCDENRPTAAKFQNFKN